MDDGSMRALKGSLGHSFGGDAEQRRSVPPVCGNCDHIQRDAQASDALADVTASARLTVKTVADPKCLI